MSLQDFMSDTTTAGETVERPKKKQKKAAAADTEEFEALRQEAKALCTCPEEWTVISKYKCQRLREWLVEKKFVRDKATQDSIATGAAGLFASALDWASGSKGHVREELLASQGWRQSFDEEISNFTALLSNRCKLAVLTTNGVVNGKQAQLRLSPDEPEPTISIIEDQKIKEDEQNNDAVPMAWQPGADEENIHHEGGEQQQQQHQQEEESASRDPGR